MSLVRAVPWIAALLVWAGWTEGAPASRRVAVTIDDLPVVSTRRDLEVWRDITRRLVGTLTAHRVPAIGFVNENKLQSADTLDASRVALLRAWTDAGLDLGNHTYSHRSLHTTRLDVYQGDVVRGEPVTRRLLAERGSRLRYFRHPFLHTGRDLEIRRSFEAFLDERGYTIAPVTIDNSEWVFARAYDNARDAGDGPAMRRVAAAYVPYMSRTIEFWERQSRAVLGRDIPHILLLHANALNADRLEALLEVFRGRGYEFISLAEALRDSAYAAPDTFTGPSGISWIHRWGITRGMDRDVFRGEPEPPADVVMLSRTGRAGAR